MNTLERLLQDELKRLVDRIAARAGQETAAGVKADLKGRIERCEDRLTAIRTELLEGYAAWTRALEECEDLWALAELRQQTDEATERRKAA